MSPFDYLCIFLLFLGAVEIFNPPISKNFLCFFALLPCFILTAFRGLDIGCDTWTYLRMFDRVALADGLGSAILHSRMEPGFVILNYVVSHLGFSFYHLQFVISFLFYISFFSFLSKYSKNIGLSLFLFLSLRYMFGPMNVTRMYLAVAFVLFSVPFLKKRHFAPFMTLVLIASLFHKTAFVFVLLYPLVRVNMRKKNISIVFIFAGIISFLGKNFFAFLTERLGIYESYLNGKYFNFQDNVAVYLIFIIDLCLALLIFFNEKGNNEVVAIENKEVSIKRVWNWSIIFILCCDIIGLNNTIMGRISGYFSFSWLVLVPLAIMKIRNKSAAVIMYIILVACLFFQYKTVMILRPNWNCVEPYYTYLGEMF